MTEHTELEEKLFEYIRFLIGIMNTYESGNRYLHDSYSAMIEWRIDAFEKQGRDEKIPAMIAHLNEVFHWNAVIASELPKADNDTEHSGTTN